MRLQSGVGFCTLCRCREVGRFLSAVCRVAVGIQCSKVASRGSAHFIRLSGYVLVGLQSGVSLCALRCCREVRCFLSAVGRIAVGIQCGEVASRGSTHFVRLSGYVLVSLQSGVSFCTLCCCREIRCFLSAVDWVAVGIQCGEVAICGVLNQISFATKQAAETGHIFRIM